MQKMILKIGKLWLLVILLTGCTMLWDDGKDGVEIGGKTVTPATIRLYGDETLAQKYIGVGRQILGTLKQQMDLGGLKAQYADVKLEDGTKIRAKSNMWGLADIDEIWIEAISATSTPTQGGSPVTNKNLSVVSFHAYCSTFLSGIRDTDEDSDPEAPSLTWFMFEPRLTAGGYIYANTIEIDGGPLGMIAYDGPIYVYQSTFDSAHTDKWYPASDVDASYRWPSPDYNNNPIVLEWGFGSDIYQTRATQTSHGLYAVTENTFAHVFARDGIDRFTDSTIIRFSAHPTKEFNEAPIASDYLVNTDSYRNFDMYSIFANSREYNTFFATPSDNFVVPVRTNPASFLPGWYTLTAGVDTKYPAFTSHEDVQVMFVVERSDGSKITKTIALPIDITRIPFYGANPSNTVVMINPILGKLRAYRLSDPQVQNTFAQQGGNIGVGSGARYNTPGYNGIDFAEVYKDSITLEVDLLK